MNHRPDHYPRLQSITLWRSVLFLSALLFAACADDAAAPNTEDPTTENPDPQPSVRLTLPAAGSALVPGTSLRLVWAVRDGAVAPDSVRLEYRANEGDTLWRPIATVPMNPPYRDFRLPPALRGSIALRIQGTKDAAWDEVSPLFV